MKHPLLVSDQFNQDPRISQAKALIRDAIDTYAKRPVVPRPPQESLAESYFSVLKQFHAIRGAELYFPYIGSGWGRGVFVELLDGSIKYDMICGIGPHFWGHSYPPLMEVAIDAALSNTIMQGHLQQNQDAVKLSRLLKEASLLDHCFLSSSGAMANENALKILFQKKFPAQRILAFEHCFMGRTLTLSQITDKPNFREGLPMSLAVDYVPFFQSHEPEKSTAHALEVLKQHLTRYPKQHAAMCFELVQGEGGFNMGSKAFFVALMQLLKEHGIPIFVDEIQTFGRTPELFAFHYFQLQEFVDVVTIGKLSQVCATLFRSHLNPKPGLLSQTFTSSTVALQTSAWIVQNLISNNFYGPQGRIVQLHKRFEERLHHIEKKYGDLIHGPYGVGAMVTFVPFGGEAKRVARFVQDLFHAGVIAFVASSHPTKVRFLIPAGIMTEDDVDGVMDIVESVLTMPYQEGL